MSLDVFVFIFLVLKRQYKHRRAIKIVFFASQRTRVGVLTTVINFHLMGTVW